MKKYILFYPSDTDDSDDPKDTILWEVKYKVQQSIISLPIDILSVLDEEQPPLPLSRWEDEFQKLSMYLIYDYSYAKEYAYFVDNQPVLTATLMALDINRFNNQVVIKQKIAKKLLNQMKLRNKGAMHPEKFHVKMLEYVDLSDERYLVEEEVSEVLYELENLCESCLQYESTIEWKPIE